MEEELIQKAFLYLTDKTYPTKNEKRCIRKKAENLSLKTEKCITRKRMGLR